MKNFKNMWLLILIFFALSGKELLAQEMPCALPPFLANVVTPNIFILMDNSGSMGDPAYDPGATYNPNTVYYGYFDPFSSYYYSANKWHKSTNAPDYRTYWPGNLLNFLTMSRVDVLRKVLVGGKAQSRTISGRFHTLISQGRWDYWRNFNIGGVPYSAHIEGRGNTGAQLLTLYYYNTRTRRWYRIINDAKVQVEVDTGTDRGILQRLADKDRDGKWDEGAPRFWLFIFNNKGDHDESWYDDDGGHVASYFVENTSLNDLVNAVENTPFETWTPLAESYYELCNYYRQVPPVFYSNDYRTGGHWDPMYDKNFEDITTVWCRKSFVLLITDGESTMDRDNVLATIGDYDNDGHDPGSYPSYGSDFLDDVALWSHVNDLRPDIPGFQNLTLYTVFAFGHGSQLLKDAAKNGGFEDRNGNKIPDLPREWDRDQDGEIDTYFEAEEGYALERAIMDAIADILRRVGSASAVSVVSSTAKGEGTVYQAFFQPKRQIQDVELSWLGQLVSYWIDQYGNIREDTDNDHTLDYTDYIIRFKTVGNKTKVERWEDSDNDGVPDNMIDEVGIWDVNSVWSAGGYLHLESPYDRNIYAIVKEGVNFALEEFTTGNRDKFTDYFEGTDAFIDSLINYIRGVDYLSNPDWRIRTLEGNTWKLADIIYSTPTYVGRPMERFDKLYDDQTYAEFYKTYKDRRGVVYVGANDGMLHAFNAGVFNPNTGELNGDGHTLGEELWAVIPQNLLAHLKWLKDPSYCHVYYVDLKPKVTDARIFEEGGDHVNGWGTVLIGGMRLGGTPIVVNGETYRSSYFALDITNPLNPRVMWEFNDVNLGYTYSYPAVLKVIDNTGSEKWFTVFGSGPTTFDGTSGQNAYVYIVDLATGELMRKFELPERDAFCGSPVSVDVKLDYSVDVIYIPVTYKQGNKVMGTMYRINTLNELDPDSWQISKVLTLDRPLTAPAGISMDEQGHLWVFFGSGKYISDADEQDFSTNYFVGIKDEYWEDGDPSGGPSYSLNDLFDATDVTVMVDTTTGEATVTNVVGLSDTTFDVFEEYVQENYHGWYVRLSSSERVLDHPLILGGAVLFTSFIPTDDPCGFGGLGYLYGVFYKTGTAYSKPILGVESGVATTKLNIGQGLPSSPSAHVGTGEGATALVQTSTGEIVQVSMPLPYKVKSGARIWRAVTF